MEKRAKQTGRPPNSWLLAVPVTVVYTLTERRWLERQIGHSRAALFQSQVMLLLLLRYASIAAIAISPVCLLHNPFS